jgi:hypothetical protein
MNSRKTKRSLNVFQTDDGSGGRRREGERERRNDKPMGKDIPAQKQRTWPNPY